MFSDELQKQRVWQRPDKMAVRTKPRRHLCQDATDVLFLVGLTDEHPDNFFFYLLCLISYRCLFYLAVFGVYSMTEGG